MSVLAGITIFPVKGLQGLSENTADLLAGRGLAGDRRFAFTVNVDVDGSSWRSSRNFLINAVNENLLKFSVEMDRESLILTAPDGQQLSVNPYDSDSVLVFDSLVAEFLSSVVPPEPTPRIVRRDQSCGPAAHWDYPDSEISIMNLASLEELSQAVGQKLDMRRFRGNLVLQDLSAWEEFGMAGMRFGLGEAEIEVTRPVRRCAATAVNPDTGETDIKAHQQLAQFYGHAFFGMYARVVKSGKIRCGDSLRPLGTGSADLEDTRPEGVSAYSLWPKLALVTSCEKTDRGSLIDLQPVGGLPLAGTNAGGVIKLHLGPGKTQSAALVSGPEAGITAAVTGAVDPLIKIGNKIVVTGPHGR